MRRNEEFRSAEEEYRPKNQEEDTNHRQKNPNYDEIRLARELEDWRDEEKIEPQEDGRISSGCAGGQRPDPGHPAPGPPAPPGRHAIIEGCFMTPEARHLGQSEKAEECQQPEGNYPRHRHFRPSWAQSKLPEVAPPNSCRRGHIPGIRRGFQVVFTTPSGFEPPISSVTGRHVRPLHHGAAGTHSIYRMRRG